MNDDLLLVMAASSAGIQWPPTPSAVLTAAAAARRFSVEYHPIVASDDTSLAWRAKARFADAQGNILSARAVFAALHANPALLLATELQLKSLALAHAPAASDLLLPLDADSYAAAGAHSAGNAFDQLFSEHPRAIVEICENQPLVDVARLQRLLHRLAACGAPLAVSRQTPAATCLGEYLYDVDWLRIPCPADLRDPKSVRVLEAIAASAQQAGSIAIVSNVRDSATLAIVRAIGFAGACGPLFEAQIVRTPEAQAFEAAQAWSESRWRQAQVNRQQAGGRS